MGLRVTARIVVALLTLLRLYGFEGRFGQVDRIVKILEKRGWGVPIRPRLTVGAEADLARIAKNDVFMVEKPQSNACRQVGFIFAAHWAGLPAPVGSRVFASQLSNI